MFEKKADEIIRLIKKRFNFKDRHRARIGRKLIKYLRNHDNLDGLSSRKILFGVLEAF
jgi:hypothetical protein